MKKIDTEFESAGFKYKQIHRENMYAIYERCYSNNINKKHYEVIRIQSHNGIEIAGNKIAPSEFYPLVIVGALMVLHARPAKMHIKDTTEWWKKARQIKKS